LIQLRHPPPGGADSAENETLGDFRRSLRSYEKLVALVDKRDGDGAERHWRAHMEAAGRRLLRDDLQHRTVVDLFA
jgi:GntR family transcriptional regulator, transcriptional repressor for pyruvate dehydrogenase complex